MSDFHFYYGSMNAGKSLDILRTAHGIEERRMRPLVLKSKCDTRDGVDVVSSRLGMSRPCISFSASDNLKEIVKKDIAANGQTVLILVDEAQFLTKEQVVQLAEIADFEQITVYAYGLRSDAFGKLFEGSEALMAYCDRLEELPSFCFCGAKATMNARCDSFGDVVTEGEQIEVGGNDRYVTLCRKHWLLAQHNRRIPDTAFFRKSESKPRLGVVGKR
ncbi:thymidine kinase [Pseudomonas luteola]